MAVDLSLKKPGISFQLQFLAGAIFDPFEKYSSKWIISPIGENKTCLKPPPEFFWGVPNPNSLAEHPGKDFVGCAV